MSRPYLILLSLALLVGAALPAGLAGLAPASAATALAPLPLTCADVQVKPGEMTCFSEVERIPTTDTSSAPLPGQVAPQGVVDGYVGGITAADIQDIYHLPAGAGGGATVAVIEVGSAPNLEADLAHYRSAMGLPACSKATGCLTEVAQDGSSALPAPQEGWDFETMLDVEAVSAACPACRILVADATSAYNSDLRIAVQTAVDLGATYVSMSYGAPDVYGASVYGPDEAVFADNPGVTFVASSGDEGYAQYGGSTDAHAGITCGAQYTGVAGQSCASYPATSPHVVSAGGTGVVQSADGTWTSTTWSGSTSGCSNSLAQPAYQQTEASIAAACPGRRASADVSALADVDSGMLVYEDGYWYHGGGTSLSAPLLAAMYAEAGNHTAPFNIYRYADAQYAGSGAAAFTDVTVGSSTGCDGTILCRAGQGWDGVTGVGTPYGLAGLSASVPTAPTAPAARTVTLTNPAQGADGTISRARGVAGSAVSWTVAATDSDDTYAYATSSTLPDGLTLHQDGTISGTPTQPGTGTITVTATGTTVGGLTPSGTVTFDYAIAAPPARTVTLANPSQRADGTIAQAGGVAGSAVSWSVAATDSLDTYAYSTHSALPAGLTLHQDGTISGTPTQPGTGTITVGVTGTTRYGATPSGTVTFDYAIDAKPSTPTPGTGSTTGGTAPNPGPQRSQLVPVGSSAPRAKGAGKGKKAPKAGTKVTAVVGSFRTASGAVVRPSVTITWYVGGKAVTSHAKKLRTKRGWRGKRLLFQVVASAPGFDPLTLRSKAIRIR